MCLEHAALLRSTRTSSHLSPTGVIAALSSQCLLLVFLQWHYLWPAISHYPLSQEPSPAAHPKTTSGTPLSAPLSSSELLRSIGAITNAPSPRVPVSTPLPRLQSSTAWDPCGSAGRRLASLSGVGALALWHLAQFPIMICRSKGRKKSLGDGHNVVLAVFQIRFCGLSKVYQPRRHDCLPQPYLTEAMSAHQPRALNPNSSK